MKLAILATLALPALLALSFPAQAADKIKIGFVSTLSGPLSGLGIEIRDGFRLALKETGDKIGGLPVEVVEGDDQASPDVGKQIVDRMRRPSPPRPSTSVPPPGPPRWRAHSAIPTSSASRGRTTDRPKPWPST
jgi:hypothetical protein